MASLRTGLNTDTHLEMASRRSQGYKFAIEAPSGASEETDQLGHDPLVGVFLEVVASVVELGHGRVGQSLAPLIENRGRERRVSHGPRDPCGLGAEVLLKSGLKSRKEFGDRSGGAGRVRNLARKDELTCAAGPGRVRREIGAA